MEPTSKQFRVIDLSTARITKGAGKPLRRQAESPSEQAHGDTAMNIVKDPTKRTVRPVTRSTEEVFDQSKFKD